MCDCVGVESLTKGTHYIIKTLYDCNAFVPLVKVPLKLLKVLM